MDRGTATSWERRELVLAEVRESPRPLEKRQAGAGGRATRARELTGRSGRPWTRSWRGRRRDHTPLLLEGVAPGRPPSTPRQSPRPHLGSPGARPRPGDRLAMPAWSIAFAPTWTRRSRSCIPGLGEETARDEAPRRVAANSGGGADVVVGTRTALTAPLADVGLIVVDEDMTPRTRATAPRDCRPATPHWRLPALPARGRSRERGPRP